MIGRLVVVCAAFVLVGCGEVAQTSKPVAVGGFPLTVRNCGHDVVIDAPPARAVSLNQSSTEILLSLGLADRMVGTATWTDPIRPDLASANARVPQLSMNKPSMEAVLDAEPDFVSASFAGTLGPGGVADRAEFDKLGVPTYLAPSDCVGKVAGSEDGARTAPLTMTLIYDEIRDLAKIFDVTDRGEKLIGELQRRMTDAAVTADVDLPSGSPISGRRTWPAAAAHPESSRARSVPAMFRPTPPTSGRRSAGSDRRPRPPRRAGAGRSEPAHHRR